MADGTESLPELKPHVSILPEVSNDVLVAIGDETEHPVIEHGYHLANEQTKLWREIIVRANKVELSGMDPRQAFFAGAMFTHEALHEQAVRDTAEGIEAFHAAAEREIEPTKEKAPRIGPFRALKLGAAIMIISWRQRIRRNIETIY